MNAADQKNIIELVMNSPGRGFSFLKVNSIAGAVVKRIGPRRPWSRTGPRKADRLAIGCHCAYLKFGATQPPRSQGLHWKKRQKQIQQLQTKHGKDRSLARQFPDLKVEQRTMPCTNGMRGSTARRAQPPGMKRFPVKEDMRAKFSGL